MVCAAGRELRVVGLKGSRCWEPLSSDTAGKCWPPGPACIVLKWSDCCPSGMVFLLLVL